ncbi:MAG: hypothetical protein Q8K60_02450 [Parachlamydiaceae bacterium]|nr:hypothetical protein [Parachlamydiaceae bacterium]
MIIKHLLFIVVIICPFKISALPSVARDPVPCLHDLEVNFFSAELVNQALSLYGIRQELWAPVSNRLIGKSLEIPRLMKIKTAYMVPNPIEYPMNRAATAKLLKEALLQVFTENMLFYGINQQPTSDFIFDYIFTKQMPLFVRCFGESALELQPIFD